MLTSLALIFDRPASWYLFFEKLKLALYHRYAALPAFLLSPYVLNLLDDSVLSISSDLRQMALIYPDQGRAFSESF